VGNGKTLTIDGTAVTNDLYSLTLSFAAESDGFLVIQGGDGDDSFTGGGKADTLTGGLGKDYLNGGGGADTFVYLATADSTGRDFDTIDGFNASSDLLDLANVPVARDSNVNSGTLNQASFNADLADRIDAGRLAGGNFVVYTPNAGTFAGSTFLIVDQNGIAGYQVNEDLVIAFPNALNLGALAVGNFI
jgi:Ca2+-binding RTX toxin-like protein